MPEAKTKKLVFTVHGIRTFGQWQQRLEKLVAADPESSGCDWDFKHKDYKFFSVFRFINPLTRWIEVRRFRAEFLDKVEDAKADRIYLVGHSFGTHIIANALRGIEPSKRPKIHLIITSGSVLSEWFPWSRSFDDSVTRVVNDCGTRDGILALNAFLPLNSGLAGRFGFAGITDNTLTNRYFRFGHSGYFEKSRSRQLADDPDWFMRRYWVPLLVRDGKVEGSDERANGLLTSFEVWLIGLLPRFKWIVPLLLASAVLLLLLYQHTLQSIAFNEETNRLVLGTASASTPEGVREAAAMLLEREAEIARREAGWLHQIDSSFRDNSSLLRPVALTEAGLKLSFAARWRGRVVAEDMPASNRDLAVAVSFANNGSHLNLEDSNGNKISADLEKLELLSVERAAEDATAERDGNAEVELDAATMALVERCVGEDSKPDNPEAFTVGEYRLVRDETSACLFGMPAKDDLWKGKVLELIWISAGQDLLLRLRSDNPDDMDMGCVFVKRERIATIGGLRSFDCPVRNAVGLHLVRSLPSRMTLLFPEVLDSHGAQGVREIYDWEGSEIATRYRGHAEPLIQLDVTDEYLLSRSASGQQGKEIDRSIKLFAIGDPDPLFGTDPLPPLELHDSRFSPDGKSFMSVGSTQKDPESDKVDYALDVFDTISGPKIAEWLVQDELAAALENISWQKHRDRLGCVDRSGFDANNLKAAIQALSDQWKSMRIAGQICAFGSSENGHFTAIAVKTLSRFWIAIVRQPPDGEVAKAQTVEVFDAKADLKAQIPASTPEFLFVPAEQMGEVNLMVADTGGRFVLQSLSDDARAVSARCAIPDDSALIAAEPGHDESGEGIVTLFYKDTKQSQIFDACWISHEGHMLIKNTKNIQTAGWAFLPVLGRSMNIIVNGPEDRLWILTNGTSGSLAQRWDDLSTVEPEELVGGGSDEIEPYMELAELESGRVHRLTCENATVLTSKGSPTLRTNRSGSVLLAASLGPSQGIYSADRKVTVWDLQKEACLGQIGDVAEVDDFAVNGDASIVAVSGGGVTQLWFQPTLTKIAEYPQFKQMLMKGDGTIALISGMHHPRTVVEVPASATEWAKTLKSVMPHLPSTRPANL